MHLVIHSINSYVYMISYIHGLLIASLPWDLYRVSPAWKKGSKNVAKLYHAKREGIIIIESQERFRLS